MEKLKFPDEFKREMKVILGEEYEKFEESILSEKNIRGLRVNTNKISVKSFERINPYKLSKMEYNEDGFYMLENIEMGGQVCHQAGMVYMQEPSAMIAVNAIDIKKNWKVLDLCAAPGGKTSQMANKVSDQGLVIANDVKYSRCRVLAENVERLGLRNVIITSEEADKICNKFRDFFDLVLVDTTCSGEGMFRKNRNIMKYWSKKKVTTCAEIQKMILQETTPVIKQNGILIYSTCTFSIEENEQVVKSFLDNNKEFQLIDVKDDIKNVTVPGICIDNTYSYEKTRRFYPHIAAGEGQYIAIFQKISGAKTGYCNEALPKRKDNQMEIIDNFLNEVNIKIDESRIYTKSDKVWILPETNIILKNNVISYGVLMGTIKERKILPSHSFFMAYGHNFKNKINRRLSDELVTKYLEGENVKFSCKNGWGVICVEGSTLGGFKAQNGILKNYYPKHLTNKESFTKEYRKDGITKRSR